MEKSHSTRMFSTADTASGDIDAVLATVSRALTEKGYEPLDQLVGFLVSGDPSYITSHRNARHLISQWERNDLLEAIVQFYLEHGEKREG